MAVDSSFVASVIVPAHNEAAVIDRLLSALPREVDGKPLQIIVACNGCTDETAEIAARRDVTVVNVDTPSKIAALNAGDLVAVAFPRLYVDADIEITPRAVEDIVQALKQPGAQCAAPPSYLETSGRPLLVRAYFTFWRRLMQLREGYVGAGVYALSEAGRSRFAEFPNLIADDLFVRNLFTREERHVVSTDPTIVQAPHTVKALFNRRVRVCRGNMQLAALDRKPETAGNRHAQKSLWHLLRVSPSLFPHFFVYAAFNGIARIVAARQADGDAVPWGRDETTRSTQPRPAA